MTANMSANIESQSSELPRKATTKTSEHRRATKPIMEKKRRARINNSLNELKVLILDALNKDPSRHSKLEKADILEMTVRHLRNVQRQQMASAISTDPSVLNKYRAGFNECATEVGRYIGRVDGVEHGLKLRILGHLNSCVSSVNTAANLASNTFTSASRSSAFPGMLPPNGSQITPMEVLMPQNHSPVSPMEVLMPLNGSQITSMDVLMPPNGAQITSMEVHNVNDDSIWRPW